MYSNMTLSPAGDAWGGYSRQARPRMECDGGREHLLDWVSFLPRQNRLSRRLNRPHAMLAHFGLKLCGMRAPH